MGSELLRPSDPAKLIDMAQSSKLPDMIATESPPGVAALWLLLIMLVPSLGLVGLYLIGTSIHLGFVWLATAVFKFQQSTELELCLCIPAAFLLFCIFRCLRGRLRIRLPRLLHDYLLQSRTVYYKNNRRYSPAEWAVYSDSL